MKIPLSCIKWAVLGILSLQLVSCMGYKAVAPVTEGWQQSSKVQGAHKVRPGETLYAIAWRYGLDYRDLARYNHISAPYRVHAGQQLKVVPPPGTKAVFLPAKPISIISVSKPSPTVVASKPSAKTVTKISLQSKPYVKPVTKIPLSINELQGWQWPAMGKVINYFASQGGMNKGIDIAGKLGDAVKATAAGKVVYCGSGLRGYGELIIIKHNEEFLTAYAHNRKLLVKEGQIIKAGQVIAEMGDSEAQKVMLHFEIRRAGKPVDPLNYLPVR